MLNNSSEATIVFYVEGSEELALEKVYNYPNPVLDYTNFQFEHNMPGNELTVQIDIYDLSGRLIRTISQQNILSGFRSEPLEWDARDSNGNKVSRGVYPYRVLIKTSDGFQAQQFEKLIVIN